MPSLLSSSGGKSRFELPALNLNFGSITDGTNIPPPPDSPVHQKVPTPPQTPPPVKDSIKDLKSERNTNSVKDASSEASHGTKPSPINGNLAGTKRSADDAPLSPAPSSRQGSIRRLFSRTTLNNIYAEGNLSTPNGSIAATNNGRPVSQGGGSFMDDRKSKRSSGWFRRLRTNDLPSKRTSMVFEEPPPPTPKIASGPPPPMIPELTDLEKDKGSLGSDLFKNIR
ncbi:Fc.00g037050.m01.CDS01 [Cosmosporella sp. VM-42]